MSRSHIQLTGAEANLRRLLLDVAANINPKCPSELRFTGGWVRDKLLGINSHDVDVAINDMTGLQFGLKMKEYLDQAENAEKYTSDDKSRSGNQAVAALHKIEANPEKSKHLETITTKIFGLDVDLVNLRKETYSEDSRNPQMEFGTPEEDALRRDATINAMFYNLRTEEVEDCTKRGFEDLEEGIIRTPLEPHQTFKDDPLRVLRLIRFASRFDYKLDPFAEKSMDDESIRQALKLKISRERVGIEVEKMLKGPHPKKAMSLIDRLGLYRTVFIDPTKDHGFDPETGRWHVCYDIADRLQKSHESSTYQDLDLDSKDARYNMWILCASVPWTDAPHPLPTKAGGKLPPPVATSVIRNGLLAPTKICDVVRAAMLNHQEIIKAKDDFIKTKSDLRGQQPLDISGSPGGRDTLGMLIRKWGSTWRSQVAFALMLEQWRYHDTGKDVLKEYTNFLSHIRSIKVGESYTFKPLIDGKTFSHMLDTPPGPWMKDALDVLMSWQLANPSATVVQPAVDAIHASGTVPTKDGGSGKIQDLEPKPNTTDLDAAFKTNSTDTSGKKQTSSNGEPLTTRLTFHFLNLTIRPLFAQTPQNHHVTPAGRNPRKPDSKDTTTNLLPKNHASTTSNPYKIETDAEASLARPWKDPSNAHALSLLSWVTRSLNTKRTEIFWPLLIPPILALIDDVDVTHKARGCALLRNLLVATPPLLLERTGLAEVFEEALRPCLSYLPSLTPQHDGCLLLGEAYPAFFRLAVVRFPTNASDTNGTMNMGNGRTKQELETYILTTHLHAHILPSLSHISLPNTAYLDLASLLLRQLAVCIRHLRQATVAQLPYLVPVLAEILEGTGTLGVLGAPGMLLETTKALEEVIANAWVRVGRWRAVVLKGLCGAWISLEEAGEDVGAEAPRDEDERRRCRDRELLKTHLKICTQMLVRAVEASSSGGSAASHDAADGVETKDDVDIRAECRKLGEADGRVRGLFEDMS
ncbi:MAG: CCA tRNA nucleotidyltransferase, mitochondrial [Alyxoria varia]|nr:MAG: CCA tRNA nucleotidyltransferase, mitochondrial [Alyxoria varia]